MPDPRTDATRPSADENVILATLAEATSAQGPPPARRNRTAAAIVTAVVLLVLGPVMYSGIPGEVARWYQAAAYERRLNGDFGRAYELLEAALAWAPDDPAVYLLRGEWKLAEQDYAGSLEAYDKVLELAPDSGHVGAQRTLVLQHLGRRREAVEYWEELEKHAGGSSVAARAMVLNSLAYARALAGEDESELREALKNIERALELWESSQSGSSAEQREPTQDDAALWDTRGFIRYLLGDLPQAREDLDRAIAAMAKPLADAESTSEYIDRREFLMVTLKQVRQNAAVMYYHRALVLEKLGHDAQADRQRVKELGFEPNEALF